MQRHSQTIKQKTVKIVNRALDIFVVFNFLSFLRRLGRPAVETKLPPFHMVVWPLQFLSPIAAYPAESEAFADRVRQISDNFLQKNA
jgi:hypothetical protein